MAAQLPDIIVMSGTRNELYSNPLEQYWLVRKLKRPLFQTSSICKRGYVATWAVRANRLFLIDVEGEHQKRLFLFWKIWVACSIKSIFGKSISSSIEATWFSGKIRIPQGNRILYVHQDYESRFERELILSIERGKVIKSVLLDYTHESLQVSYAENFN